MRRLDRYVLSAFLWTWLAAFVFFVGMYLVIHFFNRIGALPGAADSFRAQGWSPVYGIALFYGLNLPFVMVQTAPFTILMGAMGAVQQMARRNELVPVLVGGVSFRRLASPLLVSGFVLAIGFATVQEVVLPAIASERQRVDRIYKGRKDDVLRRLRQIRDGRGTIFHIKSYDVNDRTAHGVNAIRPRSEGGSREYYDTLRFEAGRGWVQTSGAPGDPELLARTDLDPVDIEIESRGLIFLDVSELRRMIARYPDRSDLRLRLHGHFAYPLGTVVLLLMGLPLVLRTTRKSAYAAAGLSLLLSIGFFAVSSIMQEMGARDELLNPVLGAWLPIVIFGSLGILMFETMAT